MGNNSLRTYVNVPESAEPLLYSGKSLEFDIGVQNKLNQVIKDGISIVVITPDSLNAKHVTHCEQTGEATWSPWKTNINPGNRRMYNVQLEDTSDKGIKVREIDIHTFLNNELVNETTLKVKG